MFLFIVVAAFTFIELTISDAMANRRRSSEKRDPVLRVKLCKGVLVCVFIGFVLMAEYVEWEWDGGLLSGGLTGFMRRLLLENLEEKDYSGGGMREGFVWNLWSRHVELMSLIDRGFSPARHGNSFISFDATKVSHDRCDVSLIYTTGSR